MTDTRHSEQARYVPEYLVAKPCPACGGTGSVRERYDPTTGRYDADDCPECDGGTR